MNNSEGDKKEREDPRGVFILGMLASGFGVVSKLIVTSFGYSPSSFGPQLCLGLSPFVLLISTAVVLLINIFFVRLNIPEYKRKMILAVIAFIMGFIPLYWIMMA